MSWYNSVVDAVVVPISGGTSTPDIVVDTSVWGPRSVFVPNAGLIGSGWIVASLL